MKRYKCPPFLIHKCYLSVGEKFSESRVVSDDIVKAFSDISGDKNPIHFDFKFVKEHTKFSRPIVHGALLNSFVSSVIGNKLPGPGTIVVKQELNFPSPCYVGDKIVVEVVVKDIRKFIVMDFVCTASDKIVLKGYANVLYNS